VPILACGFVLSYFCFAIYFSSLKLGFTLY
jgi:hypothetical protein